MIGILTAVREELKPILKRMPSVDTESAGGIFFYRGRLADRDVVLARSGMGDERARHAARTLIERFHPVSILAVGFAGGLSAEALPGDLVLANAVGDSAPDPGLLRAAEQTRLSGVRIHAVPLLSSAEIVHTVEAKRNLAAENPAALAVDMESHAVAETAAGAGIPWLAVRAITDGAAEALPDLREPITGRPCIDPGTGEVIPLRMAAMVLLCPRALPGLVQLGRRASVAARNLADFVESYVAGLPDSESGPTGA